MSLYVYNSSVSAKVMAERVLESFKDGELASLRSYEENRNIKTHKKSLTLVRYIKTKLKITSFKYSEYDGETKTLKAVKEFRDREREENTTSMLKIPHLSLRIYNAETVALRSAITHDNKTFGVTIRIKDMAELRVAVKKGMKVIEAIRGRKYYSKPNFDLMEPVLEQLLAKLNGVMQLYKVTIGGRDFNIIACGEDSAMNMLKGTMSVKMVESDVTGMPGIVDDDIDAEHY